MSGVNIWIAFKIAIIMPMSGFYAWLLTRWMQRHHLPVPDEAGATASLAAAAATAQPIAEHIKRPGHSSADPQA
jgi:hypothetical protein